MTNSHEVEPEEAAAEPAKEKDKFEVWMDEHPKSAGGIGCLALLLVIAIVGSVFGAVFGGDDDEAKPAASRSTPTTKVEAKPTKATLVADAVAAVQKKYEKLPERKDLALEGTYRSKSKVCVDQTTPDGDVFGFVVVKMPKGTFGDVKDGTCAKPALDAVDVTKVIKDKLGKSNRDVKRLESVVYNDDAGLGAVVIRWAINGNVTNGLTKKSAKLDIAEMLKEIQGLQKEGLNVEQVMFSGTYPLTDNLGDTKELKVVQADYSGVTVKKINFDNFLNKNVYKIADKATIHPAFED